MFFNKCFDIILTFAALTACTGHFPDILKAPCAIVHSFENVPLADFLTGTNNFIRIHAFNLSFICMKDYTQVNVLPECMEMQF